RCRRTAAEPDAPPRHYPAGAAGDHPSDDEPVPQRTQEFLLRRGDRLSRARQRVHGLGAQQHRPSDRDHRHHAQRLPGDRPRRLGTDELVQRQDGAGDAMTRTLRTIREKLFATPLDIVITLVIAFLLWRILVPLTDWMLLDANFAGTTRADCTAEGA